MNSFQQRITLRIFAIHGVIILLMVIVPMIQGCFRSKPKEIVTFIEFGSPAPQVQVEQVKNMTEPETVTPQPAPPDKIPERIPDPVKKIKPVPIKKTEPKKLEPKKTEPKKVIKPKKYTKAEDIKIGPVVKDTPPQKTSTSAADIKNALSDLAKSTKPSTGNPSQFNDYYARVMSLFYNHWTPPASASSATGSTVVRIYMRKNGQITKRVKKKGSGDSQYDKTVMNAVNEVKLMPSPPSNYPYDYVQITFTLDN